MKTTIHLILLLTTLLLTASMPRQDHASDFVVVVNLENPVTALTAGEAKLLWLRKIKKRWPGLKKNIKPADRKGPGKERDAFYSKILSMHSEEVESYFILKQYQNAEKPPEKFASDKEVIEFVASEPGAIGYVSSAVAHAHEDKVKIVLSF